MLNVFIWSIFSSSVMPRVHLDVKVRATLDKLLQNVVLCGYRVAVTGSIWHYRIYVAVTGLHVATCDHIPAKQTPSRNSHTDPHNCHEVAMSYSISQTSSYLALTQQLYVKQTFMRQKQENKRKQRHWFGSGKVKEEKALESEIKMNHTILEIKCRSHSYK